MYRIDMDSDYERPDVKDAYAACRSHALGLQDYYDAISKSILIESEDKDQGRISDAKKELIAQARQQIMLIPVSISLQEMADENSCLDLVNQLNTRINSEKSSVIGLINVMTKGKATMLAASFLYEMAGRTKELHSKQINYSFESLTHKGKKEKKSYQRYIKENAYTEFLTDFIRSLESCFEEDELHSKYSDIVKYEFLNPNTPDNKSAKIVLKIKDINLSGIAAKLTSKLDIYLEIRKQLVETYLEAPALNSKTILDINKYSIDTIKKTLAQHTAHIDEKCPIEDIGKQVKKFSVVDNNMTYEDIIDRMSAVLHCQYLIMSSDNIISSSIESLNKLISIAKNAIKLEESHARLKSLLSKHTRIVNDEPVIEHQPRLPENDIEQQHEPRPSTPVKQVDPISTDMIYSPEIIKYRESVSKKMDTYKLKKSENTYASQRTEKTFNKKNLDMFFKTPTPHFELKQNDFEKFMIELGATVQKSAGNGSNVKITLNRDSVLIIPKNDVINNSMNYHMQHNKGHKETCVSRGVIESARGFFRRAGLYDYLYQEYLKNQEPSNTTSITSKKTLQF